MPKLDSTMSPSPAGTAETAPSTPSDMEQLFASGGNSLPLENPKLTLHGPPGSGKTFCALTIDDDMPEKLPRKDPSEPIVLRKTAHFGFDDGSLDGLIEHNIRPAFHFSINKWIGEGGYETARDPVTYEEKIVLKRTIIMAVEQVINLAYYAVYNRGITNLIFDTVSMLHTGLVARAMYLHSIGTWKTRQGKPNDYARWDYVQAAHRDFYGRIAALHATAIFCAHSAALTTPEDDVGKAKQQATHLPGQYDKLPSVGGKGLEIYTGNVTIEASVQAFEDPKTKALNRYLFAKPSDGFRAKNRLQFSFDEREPCNLRLLLAKARRTAGAA